MYLLSYYPPFMALNSLKCADVPLRNYSLTHTLTIPSATSALSFCKMCHCPRRFLPLSEKKPLEELLQVFPGWVPFVSCRQWNVQPVSHPVTFWASTRLLREEMSLLLCCCLKPVPRRQHIQMTKKNKMQPNVRQTYRQTCSTVQFVTVFCRTAEDKKTEAQRSREGKLLQQLLVTVHRRNNIVDSMEEDRKRFICTDIYQWSCSVLMYNLLTVLGIDRVRCIGVKWMLFCCLFYRYLAEDEEIDRISKASQGKCRYLQLFFCCRCYNVNVTELVGWLEFNVPFRHKYGYIRGDETRVIKGWSHRREACSSAHIHCFVETKKYSPGTTPSPWNLGSKWPTPSWQQLVSTRFAL